MKEKRYILKNTSQVIELLEYINIPRYKYKKPEINKRCWYCLGDNHNIIVDGLTKEERTLLTLYLGNKLEKIHSFPRKFIYFPSNIKEVEGDCYLEYTKLKSLSNLQIVGGTLLLSGSIGLKDTGNLRYVNTIDMGAFLGDFLIKENLKVEEIRMNKIIKDRQRIIIPESLQERVVYTQW